MASKKAISSGDAFHLRGRKCIHVHLQRLNEFISTFSKCIFVFPLRPKWPQSVSVIMIGYAK